MQFLLEWSGFWNLLNIFWLMSHLRILLLLQYVFQIYKLDIIRYPKRPIISDDLIHLKMTFLNLYNLNVYLKPIHVVT